LSQKSGRKSSLFCRTCSLETGKNNNPKIIKNSHQVAWLRFWTVYHNRHSHASHGVRVSRACQDLGAHKSYNSLSLGSKHVNNDGSARIVRRPGVIAGLTIFRNDDHDASFLSRLALKMDVSENVDVGLPSYLRVHPQHIQYTPTLTHFYGSSPTTRRVWVSILYCRVTLD
jgi:hypothetical protein